MTHPLHNDITTIKNRLVASLDDIVALLFSARRIVPHAYEYRIGNKGSLAIRQIDGAFYDHDTGENGDIFTLIMYAFKTDFKGALVWARGFLGNAARPVASNHQKPKRHDPDAWAMQQKAKALAIIARRKPLKGTIAEHYLRQHRGIELVSLPETLGFVEYVYNYTAGRFLPALVASIQNIHGEIVAAHCTFLDPATGDKVRGEGIKSRLIFGGCRGAAIHLAEATHRVALCEGIEDGLSIMQASGDWPVWATGGTSGLRSLELLASVREVLLCGDNDVAGREAVTVVAERFTREGRMVRMAFPPEGFKDFNDLLRSQEL